MRRALARRGLPWLILTGLYAAGALGAAPRPGAAVTGAEARVLGGAASVGDGGGLAGVRVPPGLGLPLLLSPLSVLGGAGLARVALCALVAAGWVAAAAVARRMAPAPWAQAGVLLVAASAPAVAAAGAIAPDALAGACLAGALACALAVRERPRAATAYGGAALLAVLPWLGGEFLLAGLPVAWALVTWTSRAGRRLAALVAAEIVVGSLVFLAALHEGLFGTPVPAPGEAGLAFGSASPGRAARLALVWADPRAGLLRWAPVVVLVLVAGWLLWRSRRDRIAVIAPERLEAEAAASVALLVVAATWAVAALAAAALHGEWFPGRHLAAALPLAGALCGWGLQRVPRAVGVVLGLATVGLTAWVLADLWTGHVGGWAAYAR